ncbi:hypothetical protein H0E86_16915 [Streptomyces sp. SCSIO-PteL053]|nr:hypothetical protein H0E86_16915 [Streptomyces sp. SCSIO-PteL053]
MSASAARHETRALLRAHLAAAASSYRHLTRHCAVCHRLLRLAMEPGATAEPEGAAEDTQDVGGNEDERPPATRPSAG